MSSLKQRYHEIHEEDDILLEKNQHEKKKKLCGDNIFLSLVFIAPATFISSVTLGVIFHNINDNNLHLISSINDHDKLQFLIFNEDISSNGINQFFNQAIDNIVTLTNMEDWLLLCEENFLIVYDYLPIKSLSLLSSSINIDTFKNITSYIKNITEIRLHNVFNQSRINNNNNKKNLNCLNYYLLTFKLFL